MEGVVVGRAQWKGAGFNPACFDGAVEGWGFEEGVDVSLRGEEIDWPFRAEDGGEVEEEGEEVGEGPGFEDYGCFFDFYLSEDGGVV